MKIIKLLLIFFSPLLGLCQIELSQTTFDLGEISLLNSDIVDFNVENISSESVFLLRIEGEQNVGFQYTSKTFKSGEKEGIRIKLNPDRKGKVERKIKLYFSNNSTPIEITVKAVVKELPKNNRTACPKFGSSLNPPTGKAQSVAQIQSFDIILYDSESRDELALLNESREVESKKELARVTESNKIEDIESISTNREKPAASNKIPITRPVREKRPAKKKKARTNPSDRRNAPSIGTILFGKVEDTTSVRIEEKEIKNIEVVQEKQQIIKDTILKNDLKAIMEPEVVQDLVTKSNLLDQSYKPNNIVFLIDASTSMREEQKMDILKKAMIELLEPLRDIDFITIVTYSGEAKVVLATSKGNLKDEIAQQIEELKADGSTNAVKGIKKAIQVGKNNFLDDGNNQIFLASDGAFNIGENNMSLRKKIKKTAKEGLTITVLGIKNDNWTNKSLKEIATLGDGDLIKIKSMRDASKVVKSMKRKALL